MSPRCQHSRARRARQLAVPQPPFDLDLIGLYHQHQVPPSTQERPSRLRPRSEAGGPLRVQNVITLSSHTKKGNPTGLPSTARHTPEP